MGCVCVVYVTDMYIVCTTQNIASLMWFKFFEKEEMAFTCKSLSLKLCSYTCWPLVTFVGDNVFGYSGSCSTSLIEHTYSYNFYKSMVNIIRCEFLTDLCSENIHFKFFCDCAHDIPLNVFLPFVFLTTNMWFVWWSHDNNVCHSVRYGTQKI